MKDFRITWKYSLTPRFKSPNFESIDEMAVVS